MRRMRGELADQFWRWLVAGVIGGTLAASIEYSLIALTVPLLTSDLLGATQLLMTLFALYGSFGVLLAPLGIGLERFIGSRGFPPAWVMWTVAGMGPFSGAVVIAAVELVGAPVSTEFPGRVALLRNLVIVAAICVCAVLSAGLGYLLKKHLASARILSSQRAVATGLVGMAAFLGFFCVLAALAPVHLLGEITATTVAALALSVLAARWWTAGLVRRTGQRCAVAFTFVALVSVTVSAHDHHARFLLHHHCPGAARLAGIARNLVDLDGDKTIALWLGGTDCAEGDATVGGITREIPGDGVDQDCRGGDAPRPMPTPPAPLWKGCSSQSRNVILITIDALRAEALNPKTMPNASALASESQLFTRAYSPATHTRLSLASLFGGIVPSDLGSENMLVAPDMNIGKHVALRFQGAGYQTFALNPFFQNHESRGLFRGFDHVNRDLHDLRANSPKFTISSGGMTTAGIAHIQKLRAERFFAWIHYPDLHAPYGALFGDPDKSPTEQYFDDVRYTDMHLGRLLQYLQSSRLFADTVIAVSSDHGEDLGEYGTEGHGPHLYETSVHVPLVVYVPGCPPRVRHEPVSLSRLGATLEVLSGQSPHGLTLLPGHTDLVPVVAEVVQFLDYMKRAVIGARFKLIVDVRNGGRVLFDLQNDPGERNNVYRSHPREAERLEAMYQRWLDNPGQR